MEDFEREIQKRWNLFSSAASTQNCIRYNHRELTANASRLVGRCHDVALRKADFIFRMDYIHNLRQYIGHRPVLLVGAAILVLDEHSRLLMMKRRDNECWGLPGGAMEPGEVVEEAAKRETFEEVNLEVGEMSLFGVFSGPDLYYKYPNGDEVYNVSIVYWSRDWSGELRLNDEHTEWTWFAANEIPENVSPPIRPVLEQFKRVELLTKA